MNFLKKMFSDKKEENKKQERKNYWEKLYQELYNINREFKNIYEIFRDIDKLRPMEFKSKDESDNIHIFVKYTSKYSDKYSKLLSETHETLDSISFVKIHQVENFEKSILDKMIRFRNEQKLINPEFFNLKSLSYDEIVNFIKKQDDMEEIKQIFKSPPKNESKPLKGMGIVFSDSSVKMFSPVKSEIDGLDSRITMYIKNWIPEWVENIIGENDNAIIDAYCQYDKRTDYDYRNVAVFVNDNHIGYVTPAWGEVVNKHLQEGTLPALVVRFRRVKKGKQEGNIIANLRLKDI